MFWVAAMEEGSGYHTERGAHTTGYLHPAYAQSLVEFGTPRPLGGCGAWILERRIPGAQDWDAMGSYPFLLCTDWQELGRDLNALEGKLVSFSAVLDPFETFQQDWLQETFPDRVLRFKEHFVADLSKRPDQFVCAHHRRNARKASRIVRVETVENPSAHIDEWLALYSEVRLRHAIMDIRNFSRCAFTRQFNIPGFVAFRAVYKNNVVGMLLFFTRGPVVYYHLGASSAVGYQTNASFALFWTAIEYFASRGFQWLNFGAGAGISDHTDGLTRFKQGWATETRPVFFCGRILDRARYARLATSSAANLRDDYFPAYRRGEFCKKSKP